MRYKVQVLDSLVGWMVVLTDYTQLSKHGLPSVTYFMIDALDVKVADLQHILGDFHRQVSESTP